jgi:glycosyltransferase involved in cell wall biosynthesis
MSTRNPLISVVLACYNQEKFIADAVRGVLCQTYSPLEIIIYDDCSPDRTAEVIENTIAEHSRQPAVRFIRNPENMSGYVVSEMGLSAAKGDFIFISHGDDIMLPDMVDEMVNVWTAEGVSLVTANAYYIDGDSKPLARTFRDPNQRADDSFETLARDGVNACCFGPTIGFERAIYEKFGWIPRYLGAYDIIYPFYAYLLNGARFVSRPLLKYRVHAGNTSLSLQAEKANSLEKTAVEERIFLTHLAHAVLMEEELSRVCAEAPERYGPLAERIMPLLTIQQAEMSKKLIRVSRQFGTLASKRRS